MTHAAESSDAVDSAHRNGVITPTSEACVRESTCAETRSAGHMKRSGSEHAGSAGSVSGIAKSLWCTNFSHRRELDR
jgi:hypothetical protein